MKKKNISSSENNQEIRIYLDHFSMILTLTKTNVWNDPFLSCQLAVVHMRPTKIGCKQQLKTRNGKEKTRNGKEKTGNGKEKTGKVSKHLRV